MCGRCPRSTFIDAAVYRGGDLVSGWIYAGAAAIGLAIGSIALLAAPVGAIWAIVAIRLGRSGEAKAAEALNEAPV